MAWQPGGTATTVTLINGTEEIQVLNGKVNCTNADGSGSTSLVTVSGSNVFIKGPASPLGSGTTGVTDPNDKISAPRGARFLDETNKDVYVNTDGGTTWYKIVD